MTGLKLPPFFSDTMGEENTMRKRNLAAFALPVCAALVLTVCENPVYSDTVESDAEQQNTVRAASVTYRLYDAEDAELVIRETLSETGGSAAADGVYAPRDGDAFTFTNGGTTIVVGSLFIPDGEAGDEWTFAASNGDTAFFTAEVIADGLLHVTPPYNLLPAMSYLGRVDS